MTYYDGDLDNSKKTARSKADFIRLSGIGQELAMFVTEFIEKPEIYLSMPVERRRTIENQLDRVIAAVAKW